MSEGRVYNESEIQDSYDHTRRIDFDGKGSCARWLESDRHNPR